MIVVFSTRVLTTPLVVMVENWRLVEEDCARTHEKRTKRLLELRTLIKFSSKYDAGERR